MEGTGAYLDGIAGAGFRFSGMPCSFDRLDAGDGFYDRGSTGAVFPSVVPGAFARVTESSAGNTKEPG